MGTTMVAALVVEQTAYLLNIGDSRAYHINENGITRLTRDHSVVEDMGGAGGHHPRGGPYSSPEEPDHQALALRTHPADLYEKELQPGDFLLLCSDG